MYKYLAFILCFIVLHVDAKTAHELDMAGDDKVAYIRAQTLYNAGKFADALPLLKKLADNDIPPAQYLLGKMHLHGDGVVKNQRQGFFWISSAALYGYAEAQNTLGLLYDEGWGVRRNDEKAAHWYFQAANQGLTKAQVNIGTLFCTGEGARKDMQQCARWIKVAMDKGSEQAKQMWESLNLAQYVE